ncbi:class I SAM-dependent methyltransferase [Halopelagius longus]|uniref:Class I SAM-dependent methyltransferase n=1 Tax=Halopelagius longus TaxID=1236180 RepID=A0A1H1FDH6_9EURY|nr:class I SAM-dependent methyltransferase [Halopelagius longus]RDI70160.1 class I SAM-dependent methyltransferase [Halopelagius longus]SDQ98844.1 Methyltransferase domain-containing protein [Halopelagius longus]
MGHHTFDASKADKLESASDRYRYVSREELLWGLSLDGEETVADLGSGTGFYTDDIAPHSNRVYAVDVQDEMHDYYRQKGVPENVDLVTADVADLPFEDSQVDAAFSTMTYHEFASEEAFDELARVVAPGGRFVVADWAATGTGESGPPLDERYTADEVVDALGDHGFTDVFRAARPETYLIVVENA